MYVLFIYSKVKFLNFVAIPCGFIYSQQAKVSIWEDILCFITIEFHLTTIIFRNRLSLSPFFIFFYFLLTSHISCVCVYVNLFVIHYINTKRFIFCVKNSSIPLISYQIHIFIHTHINNLYKVENYWRQEFFIIFIICCFAKERSMWGICGYWGKS